MSASREAVSSGQRERSLRITHPHAAGIDVHAGVHWVAVPTEDAPPEPPGHPPTLPRQRQMLLRYASMHIQHIQKALE